MDKSKHRGDAATSEVGERGHGLTTLVKTMQSRQQTDFSIQTKQRQRLGCATGLGVVSLPLTQHQPPPAKANTPESASKRL